MLYERNSVLLNDFHAFPQRALPPCPSDPGYFLFALGFSSSPLLTGEIVFGSISQASICFWVPRADLSYSTLYPWGPSMRPEGTDEGKLQNKAIGFLSSRWFACKIHFLVMHHEIGKQTNAQRQEKKNPPKSLSYWVLTVPLLVDQRWGSPNLCSHILKWTHLCTCH